MSATDEEISRKAYEIWEAKGRPDGMDEDDWMVAKQMLEAAEVVELRGHIDIVSRKRVAGWVRNKQDLNNPVVVAVLVDGETIAEMVASLYRKDLETAGVGDGCFSYNFVLDERVWSNGTHKVEVMCPILGIPAPGGRKKIDAFEAELAGA